MDANSLLPAGIHGETWSMVDRGAIYCGGNPVRNRRSYRNRWCIKLRRPQLACIHMVLLLPSRDPSSSQHEQWRNFPVPRDNHKLKRHKDNPAVNVTGVDAGLFVCVVVLWCGFGVENGG